MRLFSNRMHFTSVQLNLMQLSIKVRNCHANEPELQKGKTGRKQWLSVTCMYLATWGYAFTYRRHLWMSGGIATALAPSAHGQGRGCERDVRQETASAESSDEQGAPPLTSMLQLLPR